MPVEWNRLRTWNGSQATAFEELVCQLASYEPEPAGSKFDRKGAPDAGVECFWRLPPGEEDGWQAKFFTSPPSPSQWAQVDSSVSAALEKHPRLRRYMICMAVDRSDARLEDKKSFLDRWNERVIKWESWAAGKNMHVDFRFWGTHEIAERLSREEHRGRHFFWFQQELFAPEWFKQRLEEAIAAVGPRYTPELNVRLPISAAFDGLTRSPAFLSRFQQAYGDIGKTRSQGSLRTLEEIAPEKVESFCQQLPQIIEFAKGYDRPGIEAIDWSAMSRKSRELMSCASEIERMVRDFSQKARESRSDETKENARKYPGEDPFGHALHSLRSIAASLGDFEEFVESNVARLANIPVLLLVGSAGTGKTHLFSDAASQYVKAGSPAILLLGIEFHNEDPWGQILRMLGLSCTRDEFLGALESAAQLAGSRAIIFIDALNEGEGRSLWERHLPSMLTCLRRHPWTALAVSVRSSYEQLIIPEGLVPDKAVRFVHYGFADHEYQAATAYFNFYGIEFPAVPILIPEFQNPLFLRCFCRGLQNSGLTRIPPGIRGISSLFEFFLSSVNEKLAKPVFLDYDVRSHLVDRTTRQLAVALTEMASYSIPREQARAICDNILPNRRFDNSLFRHLLSEGVLAETIWYSGNGQHQEMITFSYERLADHLVMRELLTRYVDKDNPAAVFEHGQPLGGYFADEIACWRNQGLAEALAIQGPEIFGKEIFELIPANISTRPLCEAFIEGLLWRDPKTVSNKCLSYINKHVCSDEDLARKLLEVFLTVAPNPEHPFNADFLHRNLIRRKMPDRDAWWSVFLYNQYGEKGSVDRLVDWAWSESSKAHVSEKSIRLVGKALIWFLTTSHRFLRDRATKALVSLFTDRIHVLCQVIPEFAEVNDPYVLERLYAVAYGCALRSNEDDAKRHLAQTVYDQVFRSGSPPPHILLRDYARGVVEVALRDKLDLVDVHPERIRPPYVSKWPLEIPQKEDIEKYGEWSQGMPDEQWALRSIYTSVMGFGDFARYILGTNSSNCLPWSKRRLDEPRVPSRKEQYDAFEPSLADRQRRAWDSYLEARHALELHRLLAAAKERVRDAGIHTEETLDWEPSDDGLEAAVAQKERTFSRTLGKKKTRLFFDVILPYLDASPVERDEPGLSIDIAQRWILKRVLDLGWTVERFGRFDYYHDRYRNRGRSADKPERIGKKYQWLAYYEFLAHAADNFEFREDTWAGKSDVYVGPWQLWRRDIDPSCLLKGTCSSKWEPNVSAWWTPVRFDEWSAEADEVRWLKRVDLLPAITHLPIMTDPETGRNWFVLECFYDWEEPTPPEKDRFNINRRCIWYMLKSYLVRAEDEAVLYEWAKEQHFMGRWMPKSHEQSRIFLGEFFWAPAFEYFNSPYHNHDGWTRGGSDSLPCDVLVTTDEYMQERQGFDCSIDETILMYLPAKWIADKMGLSWRGIEGRFFDPKGNLVVQDPSVRQPGPRALLMDMEYMSALLHNEGYRLVWTLLGEKIIRYAWGKDESWPGRMEISGCMRIKDGSLDGEATAYWVRHEPDREKLGKINIP